MIKQSASSVRIGLSYAKMKRYKFIFEDGNTFSVVASSIAEAESIIVKPEKLLTITKLGWY